MIGTGAGRAIARFRRQFATTFQFEAPRQSTTFGTHFFMETGVMLERSQSRSNDILVV